MRGRQVVWWIAALLASFALWEFTSAGYIHAKAFVAQRLIASSWKEALATGRAQRPWPWADMRPIFHSTPYSPARRCATSSSPTASAEGG